MRAVLERPRVGKQNSIHQILGSLRKVEGDEVIRDLRSAGRRPFVRLVLITFGRDKQKSKRPQTIFHRLA